MRSPATRTPRGHGFNPFSSRKHKTTQVQQDSSKKWDAPWMRRTLLTSYLIYKAVSLYHHGCRGIKDRAYHILATPTEVRNGGISWHDYKQFVAPFINFITISPEKFSNSCLLCIYYVLLVLVLFAYLPVFVYAPRKATRLNLSRGVNVRAGTLSVNVSTWHERALAEQRTSEGLPEKNINISLPLDSELSVNGCQLGEARIRHRSDNVHRWRGNLANSALSADKFCNMNHPCLDWADIRCESYKGKKRRTYSVTKNFSNLTSLC